MAVTGTDCATPPQPGGCGWPLVCATGEAQRTSTARLTAAAVPCGHEETVPGVSWHFLLPHWGWGLALVGGVRKRRVSECASAVKGRGLLGFVGFFLSPALLLKISTLGETFPCGHGGPTAAGHWAAGKRLPEDWDRLGS